MSLSKRLQDSKGAPVILDDGRAAVAIWQRQIAKMERVRIRRVSAVESPTQALRLMVDGGTLFVNGQQLTDVVLWADTSPSIVEMEVQPKKRRATLKVWNAWRDDGVMQAWLGNAGMLVEDTAQGVLLRCSDGIGDADFSDLLVDLSFE